MGALCLGQGNGPPLLQSFAFMVAKKCLGEVDSCSAWLSEVEFANI